VSDVAAIVPVHNGAATLERTLRSIVEQSYRSWRLYVVDDGSSDATPEVVRAFLHDDRVTYLRQVNAGQAAAINEALRRTREPWIALCDADDLWAPQRLERLLSVVARQPRVGFLCNDFARQADPDAPWRSAWTERGYHPVSGDAFDRLLEENFVARPATLISRAVLAEVGPFSEYVGGKCGSDDRDMWLRVARRFEILCVPEVLTFIREHAGRDSSSLRAQESKVRLWQVWRRKVSGDGAHRRRQVRRNLAEALFEAAYGRRRDPRGRPAACRRFAQAGLLRRSPVRSIALAGQCILHAAVPAGAWTASRRCV
jgi:glycosyltransferase involved in cell wall biosynthesis